MDLDIVDAPSIDCHFRTVQSEPPTSAETQFEPSASNPLADDDHYHYQDIVWARLPGCIRPPKSDKLRAWFWKYGYYVQQGPNSERYWLCRECHSKKPIARLDTLLPEWTISRNILSTSIGYQRLGLFPGNAAVLCSGNCT